MAKSTVAVKFTGDTKDLKRATDDAERNLGGFGKRAGSVVTKALAGVGVAAGAALVEGFGDKIERERVGNRIAASLGLTDADAHALGETAGEVYADGFGESFEQVNEATAGVMQQLAEFGESDFGIEAITKRALDLSEIFQQDVQAVIDSTGILLRNGLADDAEEAFDTITVALQRVPAEMRGEALDAIGEYSQSFAALGMDAKDALELIVATGQDTSVGIDKVGDAIKEFTIRATDGSKATVDALAAIGLESSTTMSALLEGGANAEIAFRRIIDGLLAIEDPVEQSKAAIALFGTPLEDLSTDQIPEFLAALTEVEEGFGDVAGASADAADRLDDDARKYQSAMRKIEGAQQEFVTRFVIGMERITKVARAELKLAGFAFDNFGTIAEDVLGDITSAMTDPIRKVQELVDLLSKVPGLGDIANQAIDAIPFGPSKNQELQDVLDREAERRERDKNRPPVSTSDAPRLPGFAKGGTVNAPKGKPVHAVVHGGEHVLTAEQAEAARRAARTPQGAFGGAATLVVEVPVILDGREIGRSRAVIDAMDAARRVRDRNTAA